MDEVRQIRIPREMVNDDTVTVVEWRVREGDFVRAQSVVVLIETSKSILELEAGSEGFIHILCDQGEEVPIGEVIGQIESSKVRAVTDTERGEDGEKHISETLFSERARKIVDEHGLNPEVFMGMGLVREVDVLAIIKKTNTQEEDEGRESEGVADGDGEPEIDIGISGAEQETRDHQANGLWGDARASAGERQRSILWLVFHYGWNTWFLTNIVRWAPRFIILSIHRMRGVKIGRGVFVDPNAILETAHPGNITIGDDVRIAAHAIIMTHIKPPLYLRQKQIMNSTIAPVILEDHCFIGINAVIMPGVRVGTASVVVSGAVVVGDVPPYCMVAGNPAKVIKRFSLGE